MRAINSERYMGAGERHLDIGCGDGYFLFRSKCRERIGLDKLLGDDIAQGLDFPDSHFDYVTMLAVIEHLPDPGDLLGEIARVLKPDGRLVFTTPKHAAEALIRLYVRDIDEQHETYFDLDAVRRLAAPNFDVTGYHTFLLGLNQVFCLTVT
jgi:ubiquinone/menaquinone biosynthesis C-methylase UbiE